MAYAHINNLYKEQDILIFKECYAMEKIHGSSAHISWKTADVISIDPSTGGTLCGPENILSFFSGGSKHEDFVKLFDQEKMRQKFIEIGLPEVTIYGEAYGGKMQGMKDTYGLNLKFVAFEVMVGHSWLSVPQAEKFIQNFGLDFVHYKKIPTTIEAIDAERDADSIQAIRNGMGGGKKREGVVLRPLIELKKNNGERIMAKHKRDDFRETKKPRAIIDKDKLEILHNAQAIAEEWATAMRLQHIINKLPLEQCGIENTKNIINAMIKDIEREGIGEIAISKDAKYAIGRRTAILFKEHLKNMLTNDH